MDTTNDEGWIKLHRKILDNPVFKDPEALQLFLYLLLKANHKPNRFPFNQEEMVLERGQVLTGWSRISKATRLTRQQIRSRLELLKNLQILTTKSTNRFSIITIHNYDHYQNSEISEQPPIEPASNQQATTNKNVKKEKNSIGRSKREPDPRVTEFLKYWGEVFLKEIGQRYPFSFEKDAPLAKGLLKLYSPDILQEVTTTFFKDEWCREQGFSFGLFKSQFGKLLSKKGTEKPGW